MSLAILVAIGYSRKLCPQTDKTGLDPWVTTPTRVRVRETLRVKETVMIPEEDRWRVPYLQKLLEARQKRGG